MALVGQVVSEKKIFEIVDGRTDDGRTTDGRTPDHGHPISSPCEPNGSGELKIAHFLNHTFITHYVLILHVDLILFDVHMSRLVGKTNNVVSEQVRHKPACTSTEKS